MNADKRKILEKIEKLLLLSKDQDGKPEGATAYRKACLMMAKHRINETELDLNTNTLILETYRFYKDVRKVPQWVPAIVAMFCETFDCKPITDQHTKYNNYEFIGTSSDTETVKYFVAVVCAHIRKAGFETWPEKMDYRKREQLGIVAKDVIRERLSELKREMDTTIHENATCTDLVVKKMDEVERAFKAQYPSIVTKRTKAVSYPMDAKTYKAGIKAGETASLSFGIEE